jgi:hypothetical protein
LVVAAGCGSDTVDELYSANFTYEYEVGEIVTFEFTMTQGLVGNIDLAATPAIFGDSEVPGKMDIAIETHGEISYFVNPGSTEGTYEIAITGTIDETSVSGYIDSEEIDGVEDLPADLAPVAEPPDLVLVVDSTGAAAPLEGSPSDLFGLLANPGSAASLVGADPMTNHLGPVFASAPLSAGSTWTTETVKEVLGTTVTTTSDHTITGISKSDTTTVAIIETVVAGSGFELSLGELLSLFFGGSNDLVEGADVGDVSSQFAGTGFDLSIVASPAGGSSTTEFDISAGRVLSYRTISESPAQVKLSFPDEATGEPVTGSMDLTTSVDFSAFLRESGTSG